MEKDEQSGIPDTYIAVSPDDEIKFKGRNNNDLESSSSKPEKHQPNDTNIEIEELQKILGAALNDIHEPLSRWCCIYKVPKDIRNIDRNTYIPQVISIGPFHHEKSKTVLKELENQKLIYILEFGKREGAEKLKVFKRFIKEKENIIRSNYQVNSSLESHEFVNMILRDAVFIIEFFLRNALKERKFDFFLDTTYVRAVITRDLQLLENQLPYFLLKNLFEQGAFHNYTKKDYPDRGGPFLSLSHLFFFGNFPKANNENRQYKFRHFTDLTRYFLLMNFFPRDQKHGKHGKHVRDLPTATKLHESGVKFKGIESESSRIKKGIEGGSSLKISCEYIPRAIRIPCFKSCELRIPCLEIDDWSECLYRNMMAFELCHYPNETHICNFVLLMNFLIDTEKDVDLLVGQGIISSHLGNNAAVATMFNNLGQQTTPSKSVYYCLGEMLKKHYDSHGWVRFLNRSMATLITVYFRDLLTATKTFAAVILLVLTFIQAVYSIR